MITPDTGSNPPAAPNTGDHGQSGGTKYDNQKPSLSLILATMPLPALMAVQEVLAYGSQKYDWNNWRKGFCYMRIASASIRHITAWLLGEDNDRESDLPHLAHAICDLLMLLTFILDTDKYPTDKHDDRLHLGNDIDFINGE